MIMKLTIYNSNKGAPEYMNKKGKIDASQIGLIIMIIVVILFFIWITFVK